MPAMSHCIRLLTILPAAAAFCPATVFGQTTRLEATPAKADTGIALTNQAQTTIIDITCPFGIDRAALKRTGDKWPEPIIVRLRLKGLESFEVISGPAALLVSVPSSGESRPRVSLRQNGKESEVDKSSPYWTEV